MMLGPEALQTRSRAGRFALATSITGAGQWVDIVSEFLVRTRHVVFVVFDQSDASLRVAEAMASRYVDIHRVTGSHLLVLSPVPPPEGWYREVVGLLPGLDPVVSDMHRRDLGGLYGRSVPEALADAADFVSQLGSGVLSGPLIAFLQDVGEDLWANAYDIRAMDTGDRLVSMFRYLGELAADPHGDHARFVRKATGVANVRSIVVQNATFRILDLASLVKSVFGFAGD